MNIIGKLIKEIENKKSKTVVLLSADHQSCSCPCDVNNIKKGGNKNSTLYLFLAEKNNDCFEFSLIDSELIQELWIQENGITNFYSILEISQDFETGNFKLVVIDADVFIEDYNSMFDNSQWLRRNKAKTFHLFTSELASDQKNNDLSHI